MVHTCKPSSQEAEARESQIRAKPVLSNKILFQIIIVKMVKYHIRNGKLGWGYRSLLEYMASMPRPWAPATTQGGW
jgi:sugar phosphate permease